MGESIKELKQKIEQLEQENLCLRQLLYEAGISYNVKINADSQDESKQEKYDPNGNDVVAIYPMLEDNMCQLLVFDFDNHAQGAQQGDFANENQEWMEEVDVKLKMPILDNTHRVRIIIIELNIPFSRWQDEKTDFN